MVKLRKFLCGCFGFLTLALLLISTSTVPGLLHFAHERGYWPIVRRTSIVWEYIEIFYGVLDRALFAMPLVLGILYGVAWWAVTDRKPSARGWAIAASLTVTLLSIPIFIQAYYLLVFTSGGSRAFLISSGFALAFGMAGLAAFARRDAMAQLPIQTAKPQRISGDGTSALVDTIAWLLGIAGVVLGQKWWEHWGRAQHLPAPSVVMYLLLPMIALLTAIVLHELGHAAAGLAVGMKLRAFIIGPFEWHIRDGRWKFEFHPARFLALGGAAGLVPTNTEQSRWREICMLAAGPLVNLCIGLIATEAVLTAKGRPYEHYWEFLACSATMSFALFAMNLIPIRPESSYSDGARVYQLLRGGPWADLHRAFSIAMSTMVTPLRPRDYDIQAIQRAASTFTYGRQALFLRLFASSYFIDRGMIPQAREALAEAESIYDESAPAISADPHTVFIFENALLRRDAASARLWWKRMEAKKPTHFGVNYWLALSALNWIEGRKEEAWAAWEKGNLLAQKLPAAGSYEFDRYRYSLLHDCIENTEENAAS